MDGLPDLALWRRTREVFDAVVSLAPAERAARLADLCRDVPNVRREVESLLAHHGSADDLASVVESAAGEMADDESRLYEGQALLHYGLVARIGEGSMGTVWHATDRTLGRDVAIKVLPERVAGDPSRIRRFEHEAKILAALNHPNIAAIYSLHHADGVRFLAMEYVDGDDLSLAIARGPMPLDRVLRIATEMATGLEEAHEKGIVHRDLKPANVKVRRDGTVKVLDFGLAKAFAGDPASETDSGDDGASQARHAPAETRLGAILGTAAYMPPEQAGGRPVDKRADIWAFGVIVFEMLSGRRPFVGATVTDVLTAVVAADPDWSLLPAATPAPLVRLIRRCLEKDPRQRLRDIGDARLELDQLHGDAPPPEAKVSSPGESAGTRPQSPSGWTARRAAALALVVAGTFGVIGYVTRRGLEPQPAPNFDGRFTRLTSGPGEELYPSLSPDGEFVAYASQASGNWDIYLQRIGGARPINLTDDSEGTDSEPSFSPDGRSIVFRSERNGGGLFIMGATGENVRRLSTTGHHPSWSPDGSEVVFNDELVPDPMNRIARGNQLWAVRTGTGERRVITTSDAVQGRWSPHGHRIAYWGLQRGGQRDIWTIAASGGDIRPVTEDPDLDWNPVWSPDGRYLYFSSDRGGAMNVWRVPIDERSGRRLGLPEPIVTPSAYIQHMSFSGDGRRLAYVEATRRVHLRRVQFDPIAEQVVGAPSWVLQDTRPARNVSLSPDGELLAFESTEGRQEDLFVVRASGTGLRRLTDDPFRDRGPRWSPDGTRILFMSDRGGRYESWAIKPDGSELAQLSFTEGPQWPQGPFLSPDGLRLVTSWQSRPPLIVDTRRPWTEQTPTVAAPPDDPGNAYVAWAWAPNGQTLAGHTSGLPPGPPRHIVTYSLDARRLTSLTDFGERPLWFGNGRRLLFMATQKLYTVDTASKRVKAVFSAAPNELHSFTLSSDDRSIVVSVAINEADVWLGTLK